MEKYSKICAVSFALAMGIVWGVSVFIYGLILTALMQGKPIVAHFGEIYVGYTPTVLSSFTSGILGFLSAFVGGFFIIFFYNIFNRCFYKGA